LGVIALFTAALVPLAPTAAQAQTSTIHVFAWEADCPGPTNAQPAGAFGPCTQSSTAIPRYSFIVNADNTHLASDPPLSQPGVAPTESYSPLVAVGDEINNDVTLPDGRYLVSLRAPDHKMWGQHITLTGGDQNVNISLRATPCIDQAAEPAVSPPAVAVTVCGFPLGTIKFYVFEDNAWTNGAPDAEEPGLAGFHVTLEEQTENQVSVDYFNNPLCTNYRRFRSPPLPAGDPRIGQIIFNADGEPTIDTANPGGDCLTQDGTDEDGLAEGFGVINNMGPATYIMYVSPPTYPNGTEKPCNSNPNSHWQQTLTFDGGLGQQVGVEENSDGSGAPGEQLWEPPDNRTGYFVGFVCVPERAPNSQFPSGPRAVTGRALNWQGWPPFDNLTLQQDEPVEEPFWALTDSSTDVTVFTGRGDPDGDFRIPNVSAGDYQLAIWDQQLNYIIRLLPVHVPTGSGPDVALGDVGVSRWFGWLSGYVYLDVCTDANGGNTGLYDQDCDTPIPNTDVDQRWRDGSIKEEAFTDANGYYEYPMAEGGALGKWIIGEQGFARYTAQPGPSVHNEFTGVATRVPTALGGALLTNQLLSEGHRAEVDWGKTQYGNEPGQIVGVTYWATTRNEFNARFQAHEGYEPAIPDAEVRLEDVAGNVLNDYFTDHWQQPGWGDGQSCLPIVGENGADVSGQLNPNIGPRCLEVPANGVQTKDGAFDGGYAFADYCPTGYDLSAPNPDFPCNANPQADPDPGDATHSATVPLVAGTYVVHAVMPKSAADTRPCNPADSDPDVKFVSGPQNAEQGCLFRPVREEDVNVDLGAQFRAAIPPPPCYGDMHTIDQTTINSRSPWSVENASYNGITKMKLCDKRLIELQNKQNANADFFMMTNQPSQTQNPDLLAPGADPNVGDVQEPGRIIGSVFNDIYFDNNPQSIWYGEPRPIGGIPVGIRDYNWRLITTVTTDENGAYEALLPSTETLNCPIPQGPCPGMYIVVVDDPGDVDTPNANFNPNYLTAALAWDVWPGQTDSGLDTPLDPISGTACDLGNDVGVDLLGPPELLQVDTPYAPHPGGTPRRITIRGDFIGAADSTGASPFGSRSRVTLTNQQTGAVTTLTLAAPNPGIVSWTPGATLATPDTIVLDVPTTLAPGPYQLAISRSDDDPNGGGTTTNGITIHVLGTGYNPPVVNMPPLPAPAARTGTELQTAINSAAPGSLLVVGTGTYNENVLVSKRLIIQGHGPGGVIGAHELQQRAPEDPRFNVPGSVVDGRFFNTTRSLPGGWDDSLANLTLGGYAGDSGFLILDGADITVAAPATGTFTSGSTPAQIALNAARIDGLGLQLGTGEGAGGLQLHAYIDHMRVTNNVLESDAGLIAGGIALGQPFADANPGAPNVGSHNTDVHILHDRILGSGGLARSGGLGIFYGSDNYEVADSIFCGNFGVEYGAGISHWGYSPGGSIHDNRIYYNDAVDSGAGIAISQQEEQLPTLGVGSGAVNVDRNLIQGNLSGDDGGGIFVMNALNYRINIRNNMIVDNGAADIGGAIMLDDSKNVAIINNTIANNVTTGSSEGSKFIDDGPPLLPHSAGLASEADDSAYFPGCVDPVGANGCFSNPVALFNNIFWDNEAFLLSTAGPGATLVSQGFRDLEVHGTTDNANRFTPRSSILTNNLQIRSNGVATVTPGQAAAGLTAEGNQIATDPLFVNPFVLELAVAGSRNDPQSATVTIIGQDPPVGLTGDYHITTASPAIDRGAGFSSLTFAAPLTQTPASSAIAAPCSTSLTTATRLTANINSTVTTINVASKANFPTTGFNIKIDNEIMLVTGNPTTTSWTVSRHQLGTTAASHTTAANLFLVNGSAVGPTYPGDIDTQFRPQLRINNQVRTPWDVGADEVTATGTPSPRFLAVPGSYTHGPDVTFAWNFLGPVPPASPAALQCINSTETRI
jgi:hypothetical protein